MQVDLNEVSMRVDALRSDLDANVSSIRDGSIFAGRNFSSVSSGINFFETCRTTIESNCTVHPATTPGSTPTPCITPEVLINKVSFVK